MITKPYQKLSATIRKLFDIKVYLFNNKKFLTSYALPYNINNQSINIGTKDAVDSPELILTTLAHELGHCLSYRRGSPVDSITNTLYRFNAKLSIKQKKLLIAEERAAWRLGFKFLKDNKYEITKYMKYVRRLLMNARAKELLAL